MRSLPGGLDAAMSGLGLHGIQLGPQGLQLVDEVATRAGGREGEIRDGRPSVGVGVLLGCVVGWGVESGSGGGGGGGGGGEGGRGQHGGGFGRGGRGGGGGGGVVGGRGGRGGRGLALVVRRGQVLVSYVDLQPRI